MNLRQRSAFPTVPCSLFPAIGYETQVAIGKNILLALLTLLVLQTSLIANPVAKTFLPLAPPDTSSTQGTISSFVENINQFYQILMPAYRQYQE